MKKPLIIALLLIITYQGISQISMQGIVVKNIIGNDVGDTVAVLGIKNNEYADDQYMIKSTNGNKFVHENKVQLLEDDYNFWEKVWFRHRAVDIVEKGWDYTERKILNEEAHEYFQNAHKSDIIFENELLYDYIYQTILEIHPIPLNKEKESFFKVLIIKSTDSESFSFDNGLMVFTTGLLANLDSKKELAELLVENLSHIVLDHNLINLKQEIKAEKRAQIFGTIAGAATAVAGAYSSINNDTYFDPYLPADIGLATYFISKSLMESAGASYDMAQISKAMNIKREFLQDNEDISINNESDFYAYMAPAVSFTAWQAFHSKNYAQSIHLNQKLLTKQLAVEDDYLLYSKLIRSTSNTKESNITALNYLTEAQKISNDQLIDLDKEAAMLYLRLGDKDNAAIALNNYKSGLQQLSEMGIDTSKELNNIKQIIFYHQLNTEKQTKR